MLASLYLNTSTQLRKDEIMQKLQSADEGDKIEAMRQIIAQMSQGEDFSTLTHRITKETFMARSNEVKRLFYYYLELIPKCRDSESFAEILLLSNQIRKDLEHPNEYVRGFAMRFVSTLDNQELVGNFYKPVKNNLSHPNAYVRRNAYFCLGMLFSKIDIYQEVPDLLYHALFRDLDPNCLRQAFVSLHQASPALAEKYAAEASASAPSELCVAIIERLPSEALLCRFLASEDAATAFEAGIALHKTTRDEETLQRGTDVVLRCLDDLPDHREYAIDEFLGSSFSFSNYAPRFLSLVDPYDLDLCTKCLDLVFKTSETHEFLQISDFLAGRFVETCDIQQNQGFRILLLEKMAHFAEIYSTFNEEMVAEALKCIASENPALAYASLRFISCCLEIMRSSNAGGYEACLEGLVGKTNEMRYGKILRYSLEILRKNISRDLFARLVSIVETSFDLAEKPLYLRSTQTSLGSFICIELSEMCMHTGDLQERIIAVMLRFASYGKRHGCIDLSSHSTIVACIRSVLSPQRSAVEGVEESRRSNAEVLDPIRLPGVRDSEDAALDRLQEFLRNEDGAAEVGSVVQLTGLSDPIYVETTASYSRYEVVLDMLFINQTSSYLQNVLLDFVTSPGLTPAFTSAPFSLSGRSVINKRLCFRMTDASNGFISGSMTFRYPGESGEYANSTYGLNLSEIRTSVADFLEPRRMCPDEFREMWKDLEWENAYTVKFGSGYGLDEIFNGIARALRGEVLGLEHDESYAVGNVACSTLQNVCVLVNVCLQGGESVHLECRIRSRKESLVKSVSAVVGDAVRIYRNK